MANTNSSKKLNSQLKIPIKLIEIHNMKLRAQLQQKD